MTTPAPELSLGTVIDGYTIGAKVRTRSGAATYAAKNSSGADVHFTVYAEACFPTALIRERSLRELRQLQGVDATQVARVLDCGKLEPFDQSGGIYEVGEVVIGDALADAGQLSRPEVGAAMTAIGNALLAAQKVGVIHRNLGGNVVFATDRGLKVIGFAVGEPQSGGAFGPIDSIAPEQVTGKVVDQRTLIYNLAAITHQLLTGQPLFVGTPEQKLDLHTNREATNVDPLLKRALSKDPRMRPMMLKQFVTELGKLSAEAGSAAPSAPKPSTRGWTMFMEAQEAQMAPNPTPPPSAANPAAPTPSAPAPAPSAPAPAPSAPAPAPAAAKPSTRGWTMFMEAEEAAPSSAPASAPAAAPASAAPTPAPSPQPVAAPEPAAAAKPSTRGWTMFMEAEEPAAPAAPAPAPAPMTPSPAVAAPAPSQPVAPAQPPAAAKPSTRGWTMFMEAEEPAAAAPAAPVAPAPAAPAPSAPVTPAVAAPVSVAPSPIAPAPAPAPSAPVPAPAAAKPSTRGWTMFMEAEAPAPAEPAPAPTPEPASAPVGTSSAPSTRGWTMFMEAEVPGEAEAAAPAAPEPAVPAAPSSQVGASDSKGWTVFMEKQPIPPPGEQPAPAPAPAPAPPVAAEQPVAPVAPVTPVTPISGRTVVVEDVREEPAPAPAPMPVASVPATPAVEARPYTPAVPPPTTIMKPEPKSKMPLYIGIGVTLVIVIIIVAVALN